MRMVSCWWADRFFFGWMMLAAAVMMMMAGSAAWAGTFLETDFRRDRDHEWQLLGDRSDRVRTSLAHARDGGIVLRGGGTDTSGVHWEGAYVPLFDAGGEALRLPEGGQVWVEFDWHIQRVQSQATYMQVALLDAPGMRPGGGDVVGASGYRALFDVDTSDGDRSPSRIGVEYGAWSDTSTGAEQSPPAGWDRGATRRLRFVVDGRVDEGVRLALVDVTDGYAVVSEQVVGDSMLRFNALLVGLRRTFGAGGDLGRVNRVRVEVVESEGLMAEAKVLRTGAVGLSWTYPAEYGLDQRFAVYRAAGADGAFGDEAYARVRGRSWVDRDTEAGRYRYRIVPLDAEGGERDAIATVEAEVAGVLPSVGLEAFDAIARGEDEVELRWRVPAASRAHRVALYRLAEGSRELADGERVASAWPEADRRLVYQPGDHAHRRMEGLPDATGTGRVIVDRPSEPADWAAVVIDPAGEALEPRFTTTSGVIPESRYSGGAASQRPRLLINREEIEAIRELVEREPDFARAYEEGLLREADEALGELAEESREVPHEPGGAHGNILLEARRAALGYAFTGEAAYADAVGGTLLEYASFYEDLADQGYLTSTHSEAGALVQAAWAYDLVYETLSADERRRIEAGFLRPGARHIADQDRGPSNWQSWHNAAVMALGLVLEDEELYEEAIRGEAGFFYQLEHAVRPDGIWHEHSIAYHYYSMHPLTLVAEMAYRRGDDLYRARIGETSLRRSYDASFHHAFYNLGHAPFGNSQTHYGLEASWVAWNHALAHARLGRPHDRWLWERQEILENRMTGDRRMPALLSLWHIREGGGESSPMRLAVDANHDAIHTVMGSTWLKGRGMAILRGPAGGSGPAMAGIYDPYGRTAFHMHPNTLGMHWQTPRHRWVSASGKWASYGTDVHLDWVIQTLSDNNVVVDRASQYPAYDGAPTHQRDDAGHLSSGELEAFTAGPVFGYAQMFTDRVYRGVSQRRRLFHADSYSVDVQQLASDRARVFDQALHVTGELAESSLALSGHEGQLAEGGGYPFLEGLESARSEEAWQTRWRDDEAGSERLHVTALGSAGSVYYKARSPWDGRTRGTMLLSREGEGAGFVTLLHASEGDEPTVQMDWLGEGSVGDGPSEGAVRVRGDGWEDYLAWHEAPEAGDVGGLSYRALAVMGRLDGGSAMRDATLIEGDRLEAEGFGLSASAATTLSVRALGERRYLVVLDDAYPIGLEVEAAGALAVYKLQGGGDEVERVRGSASGEAVAWEAQPGGRYVLSAEDVDPAELDLPDFEPILDGELISRR